MAKQPEKPAADPRKERDDPVTREVTETARQSVREPVRIDGETLEATTAAIARGEELRAEYYEVEKSRAELEAKHEQRRMENARSLAGMTDVERAGETLANTPGVTTLVVVDPENNVAAPRKMKAFTPETGVLPAVHEEMNAGKAALNRVKN